MPSFQILPSDLSIWEIYQVTKDFHLCSWLLSSGLSKIRAKLAISHKHNIFFAKFLKCCWTTTYLHHLQAFADEVKIIWKSFEFMLSIFLLKGLSHQTVFKNALENSARLGLKWLTKAIETIKRYYRCFCHCYSLCFYISVI